MFSDRDRSDTETVASLFPPFVACEAVRFAPGEEARFAGIELPLQLDRAVEGRKLEFLAGRFCATRALRHLVPTWPEGAIPIGVDRAPAWPAGIVGAITHARGRAAAAVARDADAAGLGLDSERILLPSEMDAVAAQATTGDEVSALGDTGLDEAVVLTLLFSAKESLFKCVYRVAGRYFDFHDARIVDVSPESAIFTAELCTELGCLASGTRLGGRFAVADGFVHTGITLRR